MRVNRRLGIAGFVLAAAALVLGPLAAVPAIISTAVVLWAAFAVIVLVVLDTRAFRIPSEGMEPTLGLGDRYVTTGTSSPERGDIVTFHPPAGALTGECGVERPANSACPRPSEGPVEVVFVKRVVAVGGDRVSVRQGRVHLNGEPRDEPFARAAGGCATCDLPREITVPGGHYFVVGDNRAESADSREWGPVPGNWIIGKARLRYWPPDRFGTP